jgi:RNA polymerase sigma-70 factor, ECF subfamily
MGTSGPHVNSESITIDRHHRSIQDLIDVVSNHSVRFRRIAMAHLGDAADAEDAVQDAVLAALTHVNQFRGQAKMSTWLTAIVINSSRMKLRQRFGRTQLSLDQTNGFDLTLAEILADAKPGPEELYCKQEIVRTFEYAMSQLSPILRETFRLRYIGGLSIRETALHLGVPSGTVKARLARARARLTQLIKRYCRNERGRFPQMSFNRSQSAPSSLASSDEYAAIFQ